jgi:hypothetical protein
MKKIKNKNLADLDRLENTRTLQLLKNYLVGPLLRPLITKKKKKKREEQKKVRKLVLTPTNLTKEHCHIHVGFHAADKTRNGAVDLVQKVCE